MARAGAERDGRRREHAEVAGEPGSGRGAWRSAKATRRRSFLEARIRPQPPRSRRARHRHQSRDRQGRVADQSTRRPSARTGTQRRWRRDRSPRRWSIGERSFTLGGTAVLSAWNAQTGALAWRKDYSASVDMSKLFTGTAASPLADGGLGDRPGGQRHEGRARHRAGPADGRRAVDVDRQGAWLRLASVVTIGGVKQIVTMTNGSIEGIDAKSGARALVDPLPRRIPREHRHAGLDRDASDRVDQRRRACAPSQCALAAGKWQAAEVWKNAEAAMYMSTPVLADGILYGLSNKKKGQIVAVDAATGALKWATEGRTADQAAILLTPAHVLVLTTAGELVLVRRSPAKYDEERRYTVADSATWAVPVLLPDGLIVRDASGVMRLTP